jgi:hypothetical protein
MRAFRRLSRWSTAIGRTCPFRSSESTSIRLNFSTSSLSTYGPTSNFSRAAFSSSLAFRFLASATFFPFGEALDSAIAGAAGPCGR